MNILYEEKISSPKTQVLFIALTLLFGTVTLRQSSKRINKVTYATLLINIIFLFYVLNYRTLRVRIHPEKLKLGFGIFSWTVPLENIASCELDDKLPALMKYGGAGIHFMMAHGGYRVSFNFLEYDRVVIRLKEKQGWVRDVSFSTKRPYEIIKFFEQIHKSRV